MQQTNATNHEYGQICQTINIQAIIILAEKEEVIYHSYQFSGKMWSKLPTSTYTTIVPEGLIAATMQRKSCHTCKRVDLCLFQDSSKEDCNNDGDVI